MANIGLVATSHIGSLHVALQYFLLRTIFGELGLAATNHIGSLHVALQHFLLRTIFGELMFNFL